jgi:hypothetical protein
MLGKGFVNWLEAGAGRQESAIYCKNQQSLSSPQDNAGGAELVVQQPALLGKATSIADQAAILADHAMTRDENGEMICGHQPANLARVEPGGSSNIII